MKTIKHYCEQCQGETNHQILASETSVFDDPDLRIQREYFMLKCMGCEEISFRKETQDFEIMYPNRHNEWEPEIWVEIFPFPLKNHKPLYDHLLPDQIRVIYRETLGALKANCNLLAGAGFRAIIEAICIDKKITVKTLEGKINSLSKNGLITDQEAKRLHAVRFLGNDSVHEMAVPTEAALVVVLKIVEHLLDNLYIIDHNTKPFLDTVIADFDEFKKLLVENLQNFTKGDEYPLAKFLGKDIRRLNRQQEKFELELIDSINKGNFSLLSLGSKKPFGTKKTDIFQHFIKTK
jgi:hypothetical protein